MPLPSVKLALRYKLLALVTFPMLLAVPALIVLAEDWNHRIGRQQLFMKVNTDLSVAHDTFTRIRRDYLAGLERLGESYRFRAAFDARDLAGLTRALERAEDERRFAFVRVWDREGTPMLPGQPGEPAATPLWDEALAGRPASGVEVRTQQELLRLAPDLAEQVRMPLVDTQRALETERSVEDRAMWLRALYPVKDRNGRVSAVIDGAVLLNHNFEVVDTIRDLVYGPGSLPEGSLGTVTVFLEDVRVSTNVPIRPGERAIGTRVSREVREHVLERGKVWIDSAFVVNDWYISAYEPIEDVYGERVGMLYAGFLEAPFRAARWEAFQQLILLLLSITAASIVLASVGARSIFGPVERITEVVRAPQRGELRRIGRIDNRDELGELARQFDAMLDLLQRRNEQIRAAADELEGKVEDRTCELREKNLHLERTIELLKHTREQLVTKEKLAAVGELTAGIAHEISNPTAVILGNLDILTAELGPAAKTVDTEVQLIVQQVYRIRAILNNLLQYSRPTAYAIITEQLRPESVLEDTLVLVRHALDRKHIRIRKVLRANTTVRINRQQLQHVLINLIINAVNAMEEGGNLVLGAVDWRDQGVLLYVKDDGAGIASENLERVFEPFFTTREKGTGLGLSVSYGIVRRYGGRVSVRSRPGRGSVFFIWLLREPELDDANDELLANVV